jgi:hypothetical protein
VVAVEFAVAVSCTWVGLEAAVRASVSTGFVVGVGEELQAARMVMAKKKVIIFFIEAFS